MVNSSSQVLNYIVDDILMVIVRTLGELTQSNHHIGNVRSSIVVKYTRYPMV